MTLAGFVAPPLILADGWTSSPYTWTYASATTFTIAGVDLTGTFTKGTRIKLNNTTTKYFVVASSSFSTDTTVTVTGGSDYSLANAAITLPFYSYQASPQGYPGAFNWTPGYTGFSANPTVLAAKFWVVGNTCTVYYQQNASGTSNATGFTITGFPLAPSSTMQNVGPLSGADNSANVVTINLANFSVATLTLTKAVGGGGTDWTASGAKGIYGFQFSYVF